MNYLVSAENIPYYHWQLELLIQSFKFHKLENNLLVCLSGSQSNGQPVYTKNILSHKNKKVKDNIGIKRGYPHLNILYDLYLATSNNWIAQPFAWMTASSVLYEPLELNFSNKHPEIFFSQSSFFRFENAEYHLGSFWEILKQPKESYQNFWVPLGNIIVFNKIPKEFFAQTIYVAEKLCLYQILNNRPIWDQTYKCALACVIANFKENIYLEGKDSLAIHMLDHKKAPFVDYEHGMPPVFHKKLFKFNPPDYLAFGEPFQSLIDNPSTPAAHFLSELAITSLQEKPYMQKFSFIN